MKNKLQVFTVIIPYGDYNPEGGQTTPYYTATVEVKGGSQKQMRKDAIRAATENCFTPDTLVNDAALVFKGDIFAQELPR